MATAPKVKVVRESAHRWEVECEGQDCNILIAIPKRIRSADGHVTLAPEPTPRWCVLCGPPPQA